MSVMLPAFYPHNPESLPAPPPGPGDPELPERPAGPAGVDELRPRKKRVITAARKEQNRVAQKIFRQRQRERRQQLSVGRKQPGPPALRPRTEEPLHDGNYSHLQTSGSWRSLDPGVVDQSASKSTPEPCSTVRRGGGGWTPLTGSASSPGSSTSGIDFSFFADDMDIINRAPTGAFVPASHTLPDPHANAIEFLPTTIFSALLHNAIALGFNLEELASCAVGGISPFYRPSTPQDDPASLLSSAVLDLPNVPPENLRPTLTQVLIPHHPSLDLIPLPRLRDRAIALSAAMPHMFDCWELKLDIYTRGGLGVRRRQMVGRGCQPWEREGWEAAPWFLTKWSVIVDEERGLLTAGEAHGRASISIAAATTRA